MRTSHASQMTCKMAAALLAALAVTASAAPNGRRKFDLRQEGILKVGDVAPDFTVKDVQGKTTVKLADLRGKPVVLIFGSCT